MLQTIIFAKLTPKIGIEQQNDQPILSKLGNSLNAKVLPKSVGKPPCIPSASTTPLAVSAPSGSASTKTSVLSAPSVAASPATSPATSSSTSSDKNQDVEFIPNPPAPQKTLHSFFNIRNKNNKRPLEKVNSPFNEKKRAKRTPKAKEIKKYFNRDENKENKENLVELAEKLKFRAYKEIDELKQKMLYFESISTYLDACISTENQDEQASFNLYKCTLDLIDFVLKLFKSLPSVNDKQNIYSKMEIVILMCQSVINLKLYNLHKKETKNGQKKISVFLRKRSDSTETQISNDLMQQKILKNYVAKSDHSWEQVHQIAKQGNHGAFLKQIERFNKQSSIIDLGKYVQDALKQFKMM